MNSVEIKIPIKKENSNKTEWQLIIDYMEKRINEIEKEREILKSKYPELLTQTT